MITLALSFVSIVSGLELQASNLLACRPPSWRRSPETSNRALVRSLKSRGKKGNWRVAAGADGLEILNHRWDCERKDEGAAGWLDDGNGCGMGNERRGRVTMM